MGNVGSFYFRPPRQPVNRYACLLFTLIAFWLLPGTGFAQRPALTSSRVQGSPTPPLPYKATRVFGNAQFTHPVTLTNAPGTDKMYVLTQGGEIFELEAEGQSSPPRLVAQLPDHDSEFKASYGLEFHPEFQSNRELFVCYIRDGKPGKSDTIVARLRATEAGDWELVNGSEKILYRWLAGGHNGGCLKFGPDGYLYISAGDAAAPFPPDPNHVGQDLSTLLSTISRIDVDNPGSDGLGYRIPDDNPFVGRPGARPEIFAYGFRNPWRMAFDRETGDLWVGDVGWELWEMIYRVQSGGNYGWSIMEGPQLTNSDAKQGPTPIIKPVAAHQHTEARSITGGQVYYGSRFPDLRGYYIYGDHVTGRIWKLKRDGDRILGPTQIARAPIQIISFGLHNSGEVYVVDYAGGIYRLDRDRDQKNQDFPRKLSDAGLFAHVRPLELANGVLPYEVIAEPWMDGGTAKRFVAIPGTEKIGVHKVGGGHANWDGKHRGSWSFPKDSVLGKTIEVEGQRVETQLMHYDGQAWQAYSYVWNESQSDAELAKDETHLVDIRIGGQLRKWKISSRSECMVCHSNANDMLLGFKPNQLRRSVSMDGEKRNDQLQDLYELGLFQEEPKNETPLVSPHDTAQGMERRARAYLHVNCAHCHRRQGGGAVAINLLFSEPLEKTAMIAEVPLQGTFGVEDAKVVAPSDPDRSVLLYRFCKLGPGHMPKLGGLEVDHRGASLLYDWIQGMDPTGASNFRVKLSELKQVAGNDGQLTDWLSRWPAGMATAQAMRTNKLDEDLRDKILRMSGQLSSEVGELLEPFLPLRQRAERVGANLDPVKLLGIRGNAKAGEKLFSSDKLSCKNCHAVDRTTPSAGPNLGALAKDRYQPVELLTSIVSPSKRIEEKYRTHTVQTADGQVLTGVVQEGDDVIVLTDVQAKKFTIAKEDIESRKELEVSLMPQGMLESLTLKQARDLLAYLGTLRTR